MLNEHIKYGTDYQHVAMDPIVSYQGTHGHLFLSAEKFWAVATSLCVIFPLSCLSLEAAGQSSCSVM